MRCGAPPSTGGVMIKLTGGDVYQGLATYSCRANQCLNGNKLRRCQANGQWSGTQPSCLSKLSFFTRTFYVCFFKKVSMFRSFIKMKQPLFEIFYKNQSNYNRPSLLSFCT